MEALVRHFGTSPHGRVHGVSRKPDGVFWPRDGVHHHAALVLLVVFNLLKLGIDDIVATRAIATGITRASSSTSHIRAGTSRLGLLGVEFLRQAARGFGQLLGSRRSGSRC